MKKYLLSAVFLIGMSAFAQSINDIPLSTINQKYIKVIASIKVSGNKTNLSYDLGQKFNSKDIVIKNNDGTTIEFTSVIDALNFFGDFGYEVKTSDVVAGTTSYIYHYILEKK